MLQAHRGGSLLHRLLPPGRAWIAMPGEFVAFDLLYQFRCRYDQRTSTASMRDDHDLGAVAAAVIEESRRGPKRRIWTQTGNHNHRVTAVRRVISRGDNRGHCMSVRFIPHGE